MATARNSILIFSIGSLGDTLVALPAYHLIRERYPDCRIVLLTNSPVDGGVKAAPSHQILLGSGLVDEYLEYPHGSRDWRALAAVAAKIRTLRPAQGVYLMPVRTVGQRLRDALFFAAAGLPVMHGLWPGKDKDRHLQVQGRPEHRESEASRLLRSIGFDPRLLEPRLFSLELQPAERDSVQPLLAPLGRGRPFSALSVGTKVPVNDWGQDRWQELLDQLRQTASDHALVFIGSADEAARCDQLLARWPTGGLNLCGKLSPRQSAAVLERAALFIGHDSGPMHLASSVGIPVVSIFAARNKPGVWFPYGNEANVFYKLVPCHGCRLSVCTEHEKICIRSIQSAEVATRVTALLAEHKTPSPTTPRGQ
jgi:ADP-heptose:LPS heptosyltransferase